MSPATALKTQQTNNPQDQKHRKNGAKRPNYVCGTQRSGTRGAREQRSINQN